MNERRADSTTTEQTETVGSVDDFPIGTMRLARVGDRRVAVVHTADGIHAIDNACPHQGYGLVTGALDGDVVTCQWHNWKFRVTDGVCVLGEEDVACHRVEVIDDDVRVTVRRPSAEERRASLWPSLLRGVDRHYVGQIARDTARLLDADATPAEIVAAAMVHAAPRLDDGIGHELAMTTDCLGAAHLWDGVEQTLPLTQALAGIAESARDRPVQPLPEPVRSGLGSVELLDAIEREDADAAIAIVLGRLERDGAAGVASVRADLTVACTRHHLGYGHGAIYTQKTFELLDRVGDQHAAGLLPWLTLTLCRLTREDLLPYMRATMREIAATDLDALAAARPPRHDVPSSVDDRVLRLAEALVAADDSGVSLAVDVARGDTAMTGAGIDGAGIDGAGVDGAGIDGVFDGVGIDGVLDAVVLGASDRLLRYDSALDFDPAVDFGWLDITHALTYANAARWVWHEQPGPDAARLALFSVFLLHDAGRAERRGVMTPVEIPAPRPGDLTTAVLERRPDDAVAHVLAEVEPEEQVGAALLRAAISDRAGSFIVAAHVVKLAEAARREAACTGSLLPLAAAARFAAAPRLERFVSRAAIEAVAFVRTGAPPQR